MASFDLFPAVSCSQAAELLRQWLGANAVRWEQPFGPVIIRLPSASGMTRLRRFTWQQAKYLALQPRLRGAILIGNRPGDWPDE